MTKIIARKKEKSCPGYISGFLVRNEEDYDFKNRYSRKTKNIDAGIDDKWYENLPDELLFITWGSGKFKNDIFQIGTGNNIYLITQKFMNVMNRFNVLEEKWICIKTQVMYENSKAIADEHYYVIQKKKEDRYLIEKIVDNYKTILEKVDYEKYDLDYLNVIYDGDEEYEEGDDIYGDYPEEKALTLHFNQEINSPLFMLAYENYPLKSNLYRYLYCSDAFAAELEQQQLKGCEIVDIKDIAKIDPIDLEPYVENDDYLTQL